MSQVLNSRYRVLFLSVHSHSTHRSGSIGVDLTQGIAGLKVRDQAKTG